MQDDDINRNLIGQGRKGSQMYIKRVQQIQQQIQKLRNKNNLLQKQSDNDIDDKDIRKQVHSQSVFIQKQIDRLKLLLQGFSKQFKDPGARGKLKELWRLASKEIERNKVIVERLVNDAPRESFASKQERERLRGSLVVGGSNGNNSSSSSNRKNNNGNNNNRQSPIKQQQQYRTSSNTNNNNKHNQDHRESHLSQQQILTMDDSQFMLQNKLIKQKKEILTHLQQKNQKINQVMNQIAMLVDEQGQGVNMITSNVNVVGDNLVQGNEELDGAIVEQRKARRKYCCLLMVGLLVAVIVVGVVFIIMDGDNKQQ